MMPVVYIVLGIVFLALLIYVVSTVSWLRWFDK